MKYEGDAGTMRAFARLGGGRFSKLISGAETEARSDLEVVKVREVGRAGLGGA